MGQPLNSFAARRRRNGALLGLATVLSVAAYANLPALSDRGIWSGWFLAGVSVVLLAYNMRKKVPFLPLLPVSAWLQLHAYLGLLAAAAFFLHTDIAFPLGAFERALWLLFAALLVSGGFGLWAARSLPARLHRRGERILFERIPQYRRRLAEEIEALAMRSVSETSSMVVADYYRETLVDFLARPRNFLRHVVGSRRSIGDLQRGLRATERYVGTESSHILDEIEERLLVKDDLDYHYALGLLLKGWLFVHIPLSYALVPMVVLHVVLIYAYGHA